MRVRPVAGDERTPEREVTAGGDGETSIALAFSPDGGRLAVGDSETGRLALWPVDPPSLAPRAGAHPAEAEGPGLLARVRRDRRPDRLGLHGRATRSRSGISGPRPTRRPVSSSGPTPRNDHGRFDPHVSWLAVAHPDAWPSGRSPSRGLGSWEGSASAVQRLRFTSDSRRLLSCERRDGLSVWPLDPGVAPTRARLPCPELLWPVADAGRPPGALERGRESTSPRLRPGRQGPRAPGTEHDDSQAARRSTPRGAGAPRSRNSPVRP